VSAEPHAMRVAADCIKDALGDLADASDILEEEGVDASEINEAMADLRLAKSRLEALAGGG
jgi:hypothetical protein